MPRPSRPLRVFCPFLFKMGELAMVTYIPDCRCCLCGASVCYDSTYVCVCLIRWAHFTRFFRCLFEPVQKKAA